MHWMASRGAPAPAAASARIRVVSLMHLRAPRWGLKITGLRVFMQMRALKIVVDVGFVTGIVPSIGPFGCAISVMPPTGSWATTPTVRRLRMSS
jgi:hypothetical protein